MPKRYRIAIGGFQHETNTFAPTKADWESFRRADGWPGLTRGGEVLVAAEGRNRPITGFADAARAAGHELVPLAWCGSSPSAHVTADAYERMAAILIADLAAAHDAQPLDALYLDLHGAMVTEAQEDGEGELLRRARAVVGPQVYIAGSLDLHANVTRDMIEHADLLDAFREYPHVDSAETGARVAHALGRMLDDGIRPVPRAFVQLDYLVGLNWQCTSIEPAQSIYRKLRALADDEALYGLSFAQGFALADIHDAGGSIFAYGREAAAVQAVVDDLGADLARCEADFAGRIWTPEEAVGHAIARSNQASRPMVMADTQDNPGGGGDGDTVGLLAELVRQDARGAVVAVIADPEAAAAAHRAGEGAEIALGIGAGSGMPGHQPFESTFVVERLADGSFVGTGPMWRGNPMNLGPMALLRVKQGGEGVRVIISTRKVQAGDQSILRHVGIEPADQKIVVLKSSVHFRADFEPIAEDILVVAAPGPVTADIAGLPYRNLRPGIRIGPLGEPFAKS